MKNFLGLVVFAFITASCFAQNFYDASTVQEIRIYFAQSNWDQMLDTAEAETDSYIMADSIKINGTTLRQGGLTASGLSALMNARNNYLSALADFTNVQPTISAVSSSVSSPAIGSQVTITANIINTNSSAVYIGYRDDVYAPFTKLSMYDDGAHNDGIAGDNVYGADIPVNNITTQYYIYAENNNIGRFSPDRAEHEFHTLTASFSNVNAGDVAINELMALNTSTQVDETGIYEDWAELYNNTNADIDLGGYYMTDDTANLAKWQIPAGTIIGAGGYLIIWCDEDLADGPLHTNFKLSSTNGESITLSNPNLNLIDQVFFGPQSANLGYARVPNGTGNFVVQAPTFNANNETTNITAYSDESNIDLSAFPNPSYGELYVKISHLIDNERIYLFNQLGQQIYDFEAQIENYLNLENMTSGFYYLKYGKKTVKVNIIN
jgi:hypothetical protein